MGSHNTRQIFDPKFFFGVFGKLSGEDETRTFIGLRQLVPSRDVLIARYCRLMARASFITVCSTVLFFVRIIGRTSRSKIQLFRPAPFTVNCSSSFRGTCSIVRLETCTPGPIFRCCHKGIVIFELSASYRKDGIMMVPNQNLRWMWQQSPPKFGYGLLGPQTDVSPGNVLEENRV